MSRSDKKEKKDQRKCPKCATELHYVDTIRQHYCYGCESYYDATGKPVKTEPEEEAVSEEPEVLESEEMQCPSCGDAVSQIEDSDRYYCYSCEEYLPSSVPEVAEIALEEGLATVEPESDSSSLSDYLEETATSTELIEAIPETSEIPEREEIVSEEPELKIVPEEKKVSEKRPEKKKETRKLRARVCDICGSELIHVEKYDRLYCHKCRRYASKETKEETKRKCPTCGADAKLINQYNRWYCWDCTEYLPKDIFKTPEVPKKEDSAVITPKCEFCGAPTKWISKYERYYCHSCKKYTPKGLSEKSHGKASTSSESPKCAKCNHPTTWIVKYRRYYCYPCKQYVPKKGSAISRA